MCISKVINEMKLVQSEAIRKLLFQAKLKMEFTFLNVHIWLLKTFNIVISECN